MLSSFLPTSSSLQAPKKDPRSNISRMTKPATLQKVVLPIAPVPLLQVNYSRTSKTPLRHLSEQDRGYPRHMIERYVRITLITLQKPQLTQKCVTNLLRIYPSPSSRSITRKTINQARSFDYLGSTPLVILSDQDKIKSNFSST